jgi:hypothetical protein
MEIRDVPVTAIPSGLIGRSFARSSSAQESRRRAIHRAERFLASQEPKVGPHGRKPKSSTTDTESAKLNSRRACKFASPLPRCSYGISCVRRQPSSISGSQT